MKTHFMQYIYRFTDPYRTSASMEMYTWKKSLSVSISELYGVNVRAILHTGVGSATFDNYRKIVKKIKMKSTELLMGSSPIISPPSNFHVFL